MNRVLSTLSPASGRHETSSLSIFGHTNVSLWSVDLSRCEPIVLRSHWELVVMDQCTRRLVRCGVLTGADGCSPTRSAGKALHDTCA